MRYLFFLVFVTASGIAAAQSPYYGTASSRQYSRMADETSALMTDAMGQPFYPQQKYNWEGKIFFPDEYANATVTIAGGKVYRNIRAKINLLNNTLLFTDSAGKEFVATLPVERLEFEGPDTAKTVFIKPARDTGSALYQLLDSGRVSLLKKIFITYKDQSAYGSTAITRIFEQKHAYFSLRGGSLLVLDRTKPALLSLMDDRAELVRTFIEQRKLKLRREADLVRLFRYYNSL